MGDRKLLWILLGLTLTFLVISAKHTGRQQKAEEDFAEEEFEEDDDDDDDEECDPSCEKKCHRLKCPLGFVRDSCGCCECASSEGEYCYFTSIKEREGQKTNLNFKGPPKKSSFLSLTPFSTNASSSSSSAKSSFLTKTLFTNKNLVSPNDDDHDQTYHQNGPPGSASSSFSSPTFTEFSATTTTTDPTTNTATSSTGGRRRNEKKQSKGRPQGSLKISNRGGKYSSESNDRGGKKNDFFPYDDIIYRTCGDYLECKPFLFTSEEEEERPQDGGRSPHHHTPIIPPFRGDDDASQNLGLPNPKKLRFKNGGESKSRFIKQLKRKGLYLGRSSSGGGNSWEHYQQQHQQKRLLGRAQGAQGAEIKENHFNWLQNPKKLTDDNQVYSDDEDDLFNSFSRFSSSSASSSPLFSTTRLGPKSQKLTLVLGTCVCRYPVTVCASDGRTYRNICHLRSASALSNPEVHAVKEGPCDPPVPEGMKPKIVSGPEYVKNVTGGTAALSCEVTGYPIPFISWLKTNVNNNTFDLPGDDKSIMTLTQGGPEKHEITAWIQIIGLRKDHEGDYSCVAFNKHGTARASNRLKVQKKRGKRRNKNKRK